LSLFNELNNAHNPKVINTITAIIEYNTFLLVNENVWGEFVDSINLFYYIYNPHTSKYIFKMEPPAGTAPVFHHYQ
jgi:hypothetical protein